MLRLIKLNIMEKAHGRIWLIRTVSNHLFLYYNPLRYIYRICSSKLATMSGMLYSIAKCYAW